MMSRKRQPAVAVLLGDRDDQAQVAAGELALGVLVLVVDLADLRRRACAGPGRSSSTRSSRPLSSSWQTSRSSPGSFTFFSSSIRCSSSTILVRDARELLHQRRDLARAQRELFEQLHAAAAAAADRQAQLVLLLLVLRLRAALSQSSRLRASIVRTDVEVQRDALADRALVGLVLGGADLHRAVERQVAVVDLLEDLDRRLEAVVGFEHLASGRSCG